MRSLHCLVQNDINGLLHLPRLPGDAGEAMRSYDFLSGKSRIPHADPTRKGTLLESKKNT
jgi:hypothetical protein